MMGDRRRRHSAQRNNLSAIHLLAGADRFEDAETRFVRQCLGNVFDLFPVHFLV